MTREDAICVMHLHTNEGVAVSVTEGGLEPLVRGITAQVSQVALGQGAALAWPALLRKADRPDPGYRD